MSGISCFRTLLPISTLALLGMLACGEGATEPSMESSMSPQFAKGANGVQGGGVTACPIPVDFIATDEGSLRTSLAAASPGDVIGLDGLFGVERDIYIRVPELTITCATPGSGLFADPLPGGTVNWLLRPRAPRISVDHLVLDGSDAARGPYYALTLLQTLPLPFLNSNGARFTNNKVTCTPAGECVFLVGTKGAMVADNTFEAAGSGTGIHFQGSGDSEPDGSSPYPIDGSQVVRNTLIATTAFDPEFPVFGAIRMRDGGDVTVAQNVIQGPWANGMVATNLNDSEFSGNRVDDVARFGFFFFHNTVVPDPALSLSRGNVVWNNRLSGSGEGGVGAEYACSNVLFGNDLQGNAGNIGALLESTTGNNTLVGNRTVVYDDGDLDCDGDGSVDPNIITGRGAVLHGVNLGAAVSGAAVRTGGVADAIR